MATINWGNALIRVHEISRGAALDAYRELDLITTSWLMADVDIATINRDIELLIAVYSPVSVVQNDIVTKNGAITVKLSDDSEYSLTLPITREAFNDLPVTLTKLWIEAAAAVNKTFLDDLKKALDRMTEQARLSNNDSSSGNAPLSVPTLEPQTIPTIGI